MFGAARPLACREDRAKICSIRCSTVRKRSEVATCCTEIGYVSRGETQSSTGQPVLANQVVRHPKSTCSSPSGGHSSAIAPGCCDNAPATKIRSLGPSISPRAVQQTAKHLLRARSSSSSSQRLGAPEADYKSRSVCCNFHRSAAVEICLLRQRACAARHRQPHLLPQKHAAMQVRYPRKAGVAQDDRGLAGTHARVAHGNHGLVLGDFREAVLEFVERDT